MLASIIRAGKAGLADDSALNSVREDLSKLKWTNQLLAAAK